MADAENPPNTQNEDKENEEEVKGEEGKGAKTDGEDSKMAAKDDSQDVNNTDVDDKKTGRTGASKSEGEVEIEDEEDVDFPGGAIVRTPTKSQTLPTSSSPVATPTSPTSPTCKEYLYLFIKMRLAHCHFAVKVLCFSRQEHVFTPFEALM